ncbi:MAG: acyloxyacyl hydrolase [Proteobacteria bacterium]|nr:acyloxyacyl hydrolase [Pseudomonadota bacterium]
MNSVESGAAVNFEALFNSPGALSGIGAPRPHVGVSLATDSYATSYAYAGLTWQRDFQQDWFLVGGFGLALHNGRYLRKSEEPPELWHRQKTLGCRVDFHWGVGVGRRLSRHWNVAFDYEHVSSGDVCGVRGTLGLENVGVRVGRVF